MERRRPARGLSYVVCFCSLNRPASPCHTPNCTDHNDCSVITSTASYHPRPSGVHFQYRESRSDIDGGRRARTRGASQPHPLQDRTPIAPPSPPHPQRRGTRWPPPAGPIKGGAASGRAIPRSAGPRGRAKRVQRPAAVGRPRTPPRAAPHRPTPPHPGPQLRAAALHPHAAHRGKATSYRYGTRKWCARVCPQSASHPCPLVPWPLGRARPARPPWDSPPRSAPPPTPLRPHMRFPR